VAASSSAALVASENWSRLLLPVDMHGV
jgi:hypothetical protein